MLCGRTWKDSDLRVGGRLALLPADPRPQLPVQRLLQQLRRRRRRRGRSHAPSSSAKAARAARNSGVADGSGSKGHISYE